MGVSVSTGLGYRQKRPHRFGIVYRITCLKNDRVYIGQTKQFDQKIRWHAHVNDARRGSPTRLHQAMREHGSESFVIDGIACAWRQGDLDELEMLLIAQYAADKSGYNTMGPDLKEKQRRLMSVMNQAVKRIGADAVIELLEAAN